MYVCIQDETKKDEPKNPTRTEDDDYKYAIPTHIQTCYCTRVFAYMRFRNNISEFLLQRTSAGLT